MDLAVQLQYNYYNLSVYSIGSCIDASVQRLATEAALTCMRLPRLTLNPGFWSAEEAHHTVDSVLALFSVGVGGFVTPIEGYYRDLNIYQYYFGGSLS